MKSFSLLLGRILLVLPLLAFAFVAAAPDPKVSTRTRSGQVSTARKYGEFCLGDYRRSNFRRTYPEFALSSSV